MGKKFFLEEVVDYTFKKYKDFRKLSIVFPNRRAGLYFQKALSKKNDTTLWSPKVQTIEEFVQEHVDIKISDDLADQINLNYLYCAGSFNWIERRISAPEVMGSTPIRRTISKLSNQKAYLYF